jgi:hypothetical protein
MIKLCGSTSKFNLKFKFKNRLHVTSPRTSTSKLLTDPGVQFQVEDHDDSENDPCQKLKQLRVKLTAGGLRVAGVTVEQEYMVLVSKWHPPTQ